MDEFQEFWEILPEKNDKVRKELTAFLSDSIQSTKNGTVFQDVDSESSALSEHSIQFLRRNLNDNPFPTYNLVNILKSNAPHELLFDDLQYYGLSNALEQITETREFDKFYCMLANIQVKHDRYRQLCQRILPEISAKLNTQILSEKKVYLSLLSRTDHLIEHFLNCEKNISMEQNPFKYMFFQLVHYRRNCLYNIVTEPNTRYTDTNLLKYQNAIQLIDVFNCKQQTHFEFERLFHLANPLLENHEFIPTNSFLQLYVLEIMREMQLLRFINVEKPNLSSVVSAEFSRQKRMVYQVAQFLDLSYELYQRIELLFIQNNEMIDQILNIYNPNHIQTSSNDFESFCIATCVKLMINLIKAEHTQPNYTQLIENTFSEIQEIVNRINNMPKRLIFIEIFYTMLFITSKDLHIHGSSSSNQNDEHEFVCCTPLVSTTLTYLKNFLQRFTRHPLFLEQSDAIKLRSDNLLQSLNDALYRFDLVTRAPKVSETPVVTGISDTKKMLSFHTPRLPVPEQSSVVVYSTDNGPEEVALDLETFYKQHRDDSKKIINRMLSPPENLAVLYASRGDTEELENIIQTYKLKDTSIGRYATYNDHFKSTKEELWESIEQVNRESTDDYIKIFEATKVEVFATTNLIEQTDEEKFILEKYKTEYKHLLMYEGDEGLKCLSQIDTLMSLPCTIMQNRHLYNEIIRDYLKPLKDKYGEIDSSVFNHQGYLTFFNSLLENLETFNSTFKKELTIQEFLTKQCIPLEKIKFNHHIAKIQFVDKMSKYNSSDFKSSADLEDKLGEMPTFSVNYFGKFLNYLRAVELLLCYSPGQFDSSPERLLQMDLDKEIARIVTEDKVPPHEMRDIVESLGKDIIHVLIKEELFPIIVQYAISVEEEKNILRNLREYLEDQDDDEVDEYDVSYLRLKSIKDSYLLPYVDNCDPFVSQIIRETYNEHTAASKKYDFSLLTRLKETTAIQTLSKLFEDNYLLTALNYDNLDIRLLYSYLATTSDYRSAILIIDSIKEIQYKRHQSEFDKIRDIFLKNLIDSSDDENDYWFLCKISDFHRKSTYMTQHIYKIKDSSLVRRLLKDLLVETPDKCLHPKYKAQLTKWLHELDIYEAIAQKIPGLTWLDVRQKSFDETEIILNDILSNPVELLSVLPKWIKLHPLNKIQNEEQLKGLFHVITINICHQDTTEVNQVVFDAIGTLEPPHIFDLYNELMLGTKSLEVLEYLVMYVIKARKGNELHQKIYISVKIFHCLLETEYQELWHLIKAPQLIIEQFLMGSRLEKLAEVLKAIKPLLLPSECSLCEYKHPSSIASSSSNPNQLVKGSSSESTDYIMVNYDINHNRKYLTNECLNFLLRMYASKALAFNVDQSKTLAGLFNKYSKRSKQFIGANDVFIMPPEPPEKHEWTPDDAASICMCCKNATFTILTRKHHCRRCGRVVCRTCSSKRMKIQKLYSDIPVRVCTDCVRVMTFEKNKTSFVTDEKWLFTGNTEHDAVVRENFSYEFAPNVQLCISMCELNLTDNECAKFFISQAIKLESLFKPIAPNCPNPEIDHELVAKMMSCLIIRAKLHGAADLACNNLLEHAELARKLIDNRFEEIIEPIDQKGAPVKMLESLIKAEQWDIAISLATKHRFNTQAIQAASAIISLKAGRFKQARDKFELSLRPVEGAKQLYEKLIKFIKEETPLTKALKQEFPALSRPVETPEKIQETIRILDAAPKGLIDNYRKEQTENQNENSEEISWNIQARIANLTNIIEKEYEDVVPERQSYRKSTDVQGTSKVFLLRETHQINSIFYTEGLRYLLLYGSHASILDFLISHNQIVPALRYCFIQNVKTADFVKHVYYPCLKKKTEDIIFHYLFETDATLMIWADYIKDLTATLDKNKSWKWLTCVYLAIKDFYKAALLHLRLYKIGCKNYADLRRSRWYLNKANEFIEKELTLTNWEVLGTLNMTEKSVTAKCTSAGLKNLQKLIEREIAISEFLYEREATGIDVVGSLNDITIDPCLPTIFGTKPAKICTAILIFIHGETFEAGFPLIKTFPEDFKLSLEKIVVGVAKYLAINNRANEVKNFITFVREKYANARDLDSIICDAAEQAVRRCYDKYGKDRFVQDLMQIIDFGIGNLHRKVDNFLYIEQTARAFMVASKKNDVEAIKAIREKAEAQNNKQVLKLCKLKLRILLGGEETNDESDSQMELSTI